MYSIIDTNITSGGKTCVWSHEQQHWNLSTHWYEWLSTYIQFPKYHKYSSHVGNVDLLYFIYAMHCCIYAMHYWNALILFTPFSSDALSAIINGICFNNFKRGIDMVLVHPWDQAVSHIIIAQARAQRIPNMHLLHFQKNITYRSYILRW